MRSPYSTNGSVQKVLFLFLGGQHQVLHSAPAAAELSLDRQFEVHCWYAGDEELQMLTRVREAWPEAKLHLAQFPDPLLRRLARKVFHIRKEMKLIRLLLNLPRLIRFHAIVVPERTTTLLKRLGSRVKLIYLPHGGGDRAVAFEPRIRFFDYVILPGQKNADRMIAEGVRTPRNCAVSGWIKLAAVPRLGARQRKFFDNDRPTVLYNPHFRPNLSSWPEWGRRIVDAFAAQDQYNLILAPHIRLFKQASAEARAELEALSVPGKILVDAGSMRSCDMSYILASDMYMGEVSSQVYEFLSTPRPCIFLNCHHVDWQEDYHYAAWHLGEVVEDPADVIAAVRRAEKNHPQIRPAQEAAVQRAAGEDWPHAAERAAYQLRDFLLKPQAR